MDHENQKVRKALFKHAGEDAALCSSHSVHRAAAQWAGRCGADLYVVKNVGRWSSFDNLAIYVSEGVQLNKKMLRDFRGKDPIFDFYPFNAGTAVSSMESTATELRAMQAA